MNPDPLAESYTAAKAQFDAALVRFDRGEITRAAVDEAREYMNACYMRANQIPS